MTFYIIFGYLAGCMVPLLVRKIYSNRIAVNRTHKASERAFEMALERSKR